MSDISAPPQDTTLPALIDLEGVWRSYPTRQGDVVHALSNINLRVLAGERLFITGHSGAGKTTLFRLISRLEPPSQGEVRIAGQAMGGIGQTQSASYRRQIGIITQDPVLLKNCNVLDNVAIGLNVDGKAPDTILADAERALSAVGLSSSLYHTNPLALSAGEQQRISLARILARRPRLILADEPTGNLDPELSETVMERLMHMNEQQGTTLIIATHEHAIVERFCAKHYFRHITLSAGKLLQAA